MDVTYVTMYPMHAHTSRYVILIFVLNKGKWNAHAHRHSIDIMYAEKDYYVLRCWIVDRIQQTVFNMDQGSFLFENFVIVLRCEENETEIENSGKENRFLHKIYRWISKQIQQHEADWMPHVEFAKSDYNGPSGTEWD